jgi:hypothetical protein
MVRRHPNDYCLRILHAWYTKGVIPLPDPEPEHGAAPRILPHPADSYKQFGTADTMLYWSEIYGVVLRNFIYGNVIYLAKQL